jgi:type II secretory pathway component PulF
MPLFRCLVSDRNGKTLTRLIDASTKQEAARAVASSAEYLISADPVRDSSSSDAAIHNPSKAVLEFTEMTELLLESGLSLKDSLEITASIKVKSPPSKLAALLLERIRKGFSFANAVSSLPTVFPPIYRGMIKVGDRIGSVERIFPRLTAYLRERKAIADKAKGALAYPTLILIVTILGIFGLSVFIMPRMEAIFSGFGGEAAKSIRENIARMNAGIIAFFVLLGLVLLSVIIIKNAVRVNRSFALRVDSLILRVPILGDFISMWETLNFSFAMETLLSGGVSIESAIDEASSVSSNEAYRQALRDVQSSLLKGNSISTAFAAHSVFPPYLCQWIAIGERSGHTERVFSQVRRYFQAEIEQRSVRFMALIEPSLIVLIGIGMIVLTVGIVIPLLTMYGSVL